MEIEVEKTLVAKKSPKGFWEQTGVQKSPKGSEGKTDSKKTK